MRCRDGGPGRGTRPGRDPMSRSTHSATHGSQQERQRGDREQQAEKTPPRKPPPAAIAGTPGHGRHWHHRRSGPLGPPSGAGRSVLRRLWKSDTARRRRGAPDAARARRHRHSRRRRPGRGRPSAPTFAAGGPGRRPSPHPPNRWMSSEATRASWATCRQNFSMAKAVAPLRPSLPKPRTTKWTPRSWGQIRPARRALSTAPST